MTVDVAAWHVRHAPTRRILRCSSTVNGRTSSRVESIPGLAPRNGIQASAGSPSSASAAAAAWNSPPAAGRACVRIEAPRRRTRARPDRCGTIRTNAPRAAWCAARRVRIAAGRPGLTAAPAPVAVDGQDHPGHERVDDLAPLAGTFMKAPHTERRQVRRERAGLLLPGALHVRIIDPVVRLRRGVERRVAGRASRRPGRVATAAREPRVSLTFDAHRGRRLEFPPFAAALPDERRRTALIDHDVYQRVTARRAHEVARAPAQARRAPRGSAAIPDRSGRQGPSAAWTPAVRGSLRTPP